jgi:hypothetical protein
VRFKAPIVGRDALTPPSAKNSHRFETSLGVFEKSGLLFSACFNAMLRGCLSRSHAPLNQSCDLPGRLKGHDFSARLCRLEQHARLGLPFGRPFIKSPWRDRSLRRTVSGRRIEVLGARDFIFVDRAPGRLDNFRRLLRRKLLKRGATLY